ncbi:hypothetical protein MKZ38_003242 [Zalerion maritima]|uniref:Uncharacterized protein n=1 Tax=Zalerion maritima TaxID=339359 RepID=A0AAD5RYX9_9PEZI|nr:hypothetical protein MKZ38_003242 [Zalerion maritima]
MQFSKIILTAFAALAAAAPATTQETRVEKRSLLGANELGLLNGLNFGIDNFAYISEINGFNFDFFDQQLFSLFQRGFDVNVFNPLFNAQQFDFNNIVLLLQLQMLTHISSLGLFDQFNVAGVNLVPSLNLGVLSGLGGFDFASLFDQTVITQVQTITSSSSLFGGIGGFKKE